MPICSFFCSSTALYSTCSTPFDAWSAPKLHPHGRGLQSAMTAAALQHGALTRLYPVHLLPKRPHSTAATKASPAYLKTQQLFQDDRQFALEQAHSSSPRITASHKSCHSPAINSQAAPTTQQRSSIFRTHSDSSADSMADSVSSYHGYAGVNYQMGKYAVKVMLCAAKLVENRCLILFCVVAQASKTLMQCQTYGDTA